MSSTIVLYRGSHRNSAFTLVELLVVVTLIGLLSSMLSVAMSTARQQSQIRRCETELLAYGTILQARAGGITFTRFRHLTSPPGATAAPAGIASTGNASVVANQDEYRAEMLLRRDYARMLLPQCQADLFLPPATIQKRILSTASVVDGTLSGQCLKNRVPSAWNQMRQLVGLRNSIEIDADSVAAGIAAQPIATPSVDAIALYETNATFRGVCTTQPGGAAISWTREHESAECLYLMLATQRQSGLTAIDNIPSRNIGDTDNDGVNEILDPWGVPLCFIREPVGLQNSSLGNFAPEFSNSPPYADRTTISEAAEAFPITDPDPYDLLGADFRYSVNDTAVVAPGGIIASGTNPPQAYFPYYAPPVVISAGPDGEYGIYRPEDLPDDVSSSSFTLSAPPTPLFTSSLPYRYPNPYFDMARVAASRTIVSAPGTGAFPGIFDARRGGGLGGVFGTAARGSALNIGLITRQQAFADDNVTSIERDI